MKKVVVVAVGKVKEDFISRGIAEYAKRLSRFTDFSVKEVAESKHEDVLKESGEILKHLDGGVTFLTDLCGKPVTSENLAELIKSAHLKSDTVNFVIGGSRGVDSRVRQRAEHIINFGAVTYPHQLFRLLLTEQLYRAFTINAGLPYHK